jgi:site-specific DNA-methyltransferase (adenine-specific)
MKIMNWPEDFIDKIVECDCLEGMRYIPDNSIDLVVTSPPYSDLRTYKGFSWDFEGVARELFRIIKIGGVVVWVVGDKTVNGSEELVPYKQCLYFREIGFNVWDTMIFQKHSVQYPANVRYNQVFEFMFVFSKGKVKTFNPLRENKAEKEIEKILRGTIKPNSQTFRRKNGELVRADADKRRLNRLMRSSLCTTKVMGNVWKISVGSLSSSKDKITYKHPATFPEELAERHILSWSNEGDLVLDPFMGSGTVAVMAKKNRRKFIGFEIAKEYCEIARARVAKYFQGEFVL